MARMGEEFNRNRSTSAHQLHGLTLIELMVTLTIMVIALGIGVPSMASFINNSRAATASNEFMAHLNLTRSEAIKRGANITLCKTADPSASAPTCSTSASWSTGWLIFVDGNTLGTLDGTGASADTLLRVRQSSASNIDITANTNVANRVTYQMNGRLLGVNNGTFTIKVKDLERQLIISNTGRVRVCNPAKQTC